MVWGVGVALAIYASAAISGAHLNPAITLAMWAMRGFERRKVPVYVAAQLLGSVLAAAALLLIYHGPLAHYEAAAGIVRGASGSELSAMVFGEYFPHPGLRHALGWAPDLVGIPGAMLGEFVGTALLAALIFALTDPRNAAAPGPALAPASGPPASGPSAASTARQKSGQAWKQARQPTQSPALAAQGGRKPLALTRSPGSKTLLGQSSRQYRQPLQAWKSTATAKIRVT
jgi:glycerol uptake facilitator-like aquaporin